MNKKELIKHIEDFEDLPYNEGLIVDTIKISRNGLLKLIEQLDEPQKVKVPQFVADWYEKHKDDFETSLFQCIYEIFGKHNDSELNEFENWVIDGNTKPFQTLVNMHQFGYKVEEEKRYTIRFKNIRKETRYLKYDRVVENWYFGVEQCSKETKISHTRKELEEAGFGEVFNSPLFEVEEVEG